MNRIFAKLSPRLALTCLALGAVALDGAAEPEVRGQKPEVRSQPADPRAPTSVPVVRPPRRLEEDELRTLLTESLNAGRNANGAEWELRITRPWTPVKVPDELLTVEILEPAINRMTPNSVLRFEMRAGRQLIGSWQVPVQARLWREVVVAESPLQRGQLLADAPVTRVRRDVLTLRDPLYELPAVPTAYELTESVAMGTPLTLRALRLKPVVYRGQTVNAIMGDNALTILLKVEVMEEGVPGQFVRVRNLQSRRELRGKVQDEQTIAISF